MALVLLTFTGSIAHAQGIDSTVVVTEINYHPVGANDTQWIELHCLSGVKVDLTGWKLGGSIGYTFPGNTVIDGRGYLVVALNPAAPNLSGALGPFTGTLTNNGEITVLNANGRVMDDVNFQDDVPWPDAADGSGATLSKRDVNSADPSAANWTWSSSTGGTPGAANFASPSQAPDANPTVVFNEISAGGSGFKLELANLTANPVDVTGMIIQSTAGVSRALSSQTLGAGGFLVVTAAQLGFTPVSGDKLFLVAANGTSVLDSHKVTGKLRGRYQGRWVFPTAASFGSANIFNISNAVVINEIMYHPRQAATSPFADSTEQWVEFYNRSSATVDLSKWQISDGITFKFPAGTTIPAGGYLVVSNDAAALQAKWPAVASKIIGNFSKKISGKGDRIELDDANGNPVNAVAFSDGGRWPAAADGDGSSLELRDPHADNTMPEAWTASDESARGSWQTYLYAGTADNLNGDPTQWNEFDFGLMDEGIYLIDNISVIDDSPNGSVQLIQNGDFSTGLGAWRFLGTQSRASLVPDPAGSGQVLQIISTGPTEHMHNHAETTLKNGSGYATLNTTDTYHVSFRARWVSGSNQLNARLYFNRLAQTESLPVADGGGTPGMPNSCGISNIGPAYSKLTHTPAVPAVGQAATVSVVASDPDGVSSPTLFYSINGGAFTSAAMTLQNGVYLGVIPAQAGGAKAQFYVRAVDGQGAISYFPAAGPDSRAMIPWDDGQSLLSANGVNPTNIRIVMTAADTATLHTVTNVMSNDPMLCTVILDEGTIFYDCGVRLHGSERGRDQDTRVSFHLDFPADQKLYGAHKSATIDRSGAGNQTSMKEILVKHGITHAGRIPGSEDDLCHVIAPEPQHTGPAILEKEYYDSAYLDNQYASGSDGNLYKFELIYHPLTTQGGGPENLKLPEPDDVVAVNAGGLGVSKELYRWHWIKENNGAQDDYSGLITMLNAYGQPAGSQYNADISNLLDVSEWLRCYAVENLFGVGDNYGGDGFQHNFKTYNRPSDGKWLFMPYDMDFTFNNNASGGLVNTSDLGKIMGNPANARLYYGHLRDICLSTFNTAYLTPWAEYYSRFLNEDLTAWMSYVSTRNSTVLADINTAIPPVTYGISTPNNAAFSGTFATIQGQGWIDIDHFQLAGSTTPLAVTWIDSTTWQITLPIAPGTNTFTINAYDASGNLLGSRSVTVIGTGTVVPAAAGNLVISEFMYHPVAPSAAEIAAGYPSAEDFEFIELQNTSRSPLDLTGVAFSAGVTYAFASGTQLAPNARILVTADNPAFVVRYGPGLPVASGQYGPGTQLSNGGEQVALSDAAGRDIVRFTYNNKAPWPAGADGTGYSLVLINAAANPDPAVASNWRLSAASGGNPGTADTTTFTGDPNADDDHNGVTNFVQYALAGTAPYIAPQISITGGLMVYQYHVNLAAEDAIITVQTSGDLLTWAALPAGYSVTDQEPGGNGTGIITITGPPATEAKRFFRLQVTAR